MISCVHRGATVDTRDCPSCRGSVRVKIFACSVHRLCSIEKPVYQSIPGRYAVCSMCHDRRPVNPWVQIEHANTLNGWHAVEYAMGMAE